MSNTAGGSSAAQASNNTFATTAYGFKTERGHGHPRCWFLPITLSSTAGKTADRPYEGPLEVSELIQTLQTQASARSSFGPPNVKAIEHAISKIQYQQNRTTDMYHSVVRFSVTTGELWQIQGIQRDRTVPSNSGDAAIAPDVEWMAREVRDKWARPPQTALGTPKRKRAAAPSDDDHLHVRKQGAPGTSTVPKGEPSQERS